MASERPLEVGGLGDIGVGAELVGLDDVIRVLWMRRRGSRARTSVRSSSRTRLRTCRPLSLQLRVEQDELRREGVPAGVGAVAERVVQGLLAAADDHHLVHSATMPCLRRARMASKTWS